MSFEKFPPHIFSALFQMAESSASQNVIQTASQLLAQRNIAPSTSMRTNNSSIGSIAPPGAQNSAVHANNAGGTYTTHSTLTQANIARINAANVQECHQSKASLHQSMKKTTITQGHHQTSSSEAVADASYYSSVLNAFCSSSGGTTNTAGASSNGGGGNNQYR